MILERDAAEIPVLNFISSIDRPVATYWWVAAKRASGLILSSILTTPRSANVITWAILLLLIMSILQLKSIKTPTRQLNAPVKLCVIHARQFQAVNRPRIPLHGLSFLFPFNDTSIFTRMNERSKNWQDELKSNPAKVSTRDCVCRFSRVQSCTFQSSRERAYVNPIVERIARVIVTLLVVWSRVPRWTSTII